MGHKFLCSECRVPQRHEVSIAEDLSITMRCRVCGSYDHFVLQPSGYMLEGFRKRIKEFAYQRALEELLRKKK